MQTLRSFGRTKGRPLSKLQSELLDSHLESLLAPKGLVEVFNPQSLLPDAKEVWFEIGFGGAEHLINQAKANPDILFIGAEPFIEGVAKAVREIETHKINNVRLIDDDARPFLNMLQDGSLGRFFIMFPDPWHKARHRKRRLVDANFVSLLARLLKSGGTVRFATDWEDYANQALSIFTNNPDFVWLAEEAKDWNVAPCDHFTTRYETKGLGDCKPIFLDFARK